MQPVEITLSVNIKADKQTVFDAVVDWETQGDWMLGTKVSRTKQQGKDVGGEIVAWTGFWKIGFNDPMVFTKWEEPNIVEVKHLGRIVKGTGSMIVKEIDKDSSTFIWSETIDLPLGILGRFGWIFVKPLFVLGIKISLNRFAHTFTQIDPA